MESGCSKWIATTNALLTMNQTMLQETYGAPFKRTEIKNKQLRIIHQGMIERRIIFASQLKTNLSSIGNGLWKEGAVCPLLCTRGFNFVLVTEWKLSEDNLRTVWTMTNLSFRPNWLGTDIPSFSRDQFPETYAVTIKGIPSRGEQMFYADDWKGYARWAKFAAKYPGTVTTDRWVF